MQTISATAAAILRSGHMIEARIAVETIDLATFTITGDRLIDGSFELERNSVSGSQIEIGNAETSQLKFQIDNYDRAYDGYTFEGAILTVDLLIGAEYLRLGVFVVDEPPQDRDTIDIIALDHMARFNRPYASALVGTPTLYQIMAEVCSDCGVTLGDLSWTNSTRTASVPSDPDLTCHEIVAMVAELAGANAYIDHTGALRLAWYGEIQGATSIPITAGDRFEYEVAENDIQISGIILRTADADTLYGADDYALVIEDNLLVDPASIAVVMAAVQAKIVGYFYRPYSFDVRAIPHIWPLDEVTVTDEVGAVIPSVVMRSKYVLNGTSEISAIGETATRKGWASASPFTPRQRTVIQRAATIAASGVVTGFEAALVQLNEVAVNAGGFYQTVITDPITGAKTDYIHDNPVLASSTIIYMRNGVGFYWTDTGWNGGSPVWTTGYTADGNIVARTLNVIGINADWINSGHISAEYLDIVVSGDNLMRNTQFVLGAGSAAGALDVPTNSYDFSQGGWTRYEKYGWAVYTLGLDVPWYLNGWIYNTLSPQEFSYRGFALLSNAIEVVPNEIYTLSILDGWYGDLDGVEIYVVAQAAASGSAADVYHVMGGYTGGAAIVGGDPAYRKQTQIMEPVSGLVVPVKVGSVWDWQTKLPFTPTRNSVTFTLPATIYGNKIYIYILDTNTSSVAKVLISKIQLERGATVTSWTGHESEYQGSSVEFSPNRFNITDLDVQITRSYGSALTEIGLKAYSTSFAVATGYARNLLGKLVFDYSAGTWRSDVSLVLAKDSVRLDMIRPAGGVGEYIGIRAYDDATLKGGIYYSFTTQMWQLTTNGSTTQRRIFHSGVNCYPAADSTYDLGTSTVTWRDIFLNGILQFKAGVNHFINFGNTDQGVVGTSGGNIYLCAKSTGGMIYLSPNGNNSVVGRASIDAAGNLSIAGYVLESTSASHGFLATSAGGTHDGFALVAGGAVGTNGAPAGRYPVAAWESYGWNFGIQHVTDGKFRIWNAGRTATYFEVKYGGEVTIYNRLVVLNNITDPTYANAHIEIRSSNGSDCALSFHRAGYTACALLHESDGLRLSNTAHAGLASFQAGNIYTNGVQVPNINHAHGIGTISTGRSDFSGTITPSARLAFQSATDNSFAPCLEGGSFVQLTTGTAAAGYYTRIGLYNPTGNNYAYFVGWKYIA